MQQSFVVFYSSQRPACTSAVKQHRLSLKGSAVDQYLQSQVSAGQTFSLLGPQRVVKFDRGVGAAADGWKVLVRRC